jgi:hypothetical protein
VRPSSDKIEEDVGHLGYLREQGLEQWGRQWGPHARP